MKNRYLTVFCLPHFLCLAVCILNVLLVSLGYSLLFSVTIFGVILNGVCIFSLVKLHKEKYNPIHKKERLVISVLPFISLINFVYASLKSSNIVNFVLFLISVICAGILAANLFDTKLKKIICGVIYFFMLIYVIWWCFLISLFGSMGQNTVVKTELSPNQKYYAQVIDSDQGALGGDTLVTIDKNFEINLLLFKIKQKPRIIYHGEWGEFDSMRIKWKNDNCLVINEKEYQIE